MKKLFCWIGLHDWKMTLNFIQPPDWSNKGSSHWNGECQRCGKRDLFRGPYEICEAETPGPYSAGR